MARQKQQETTVEVSKATSEDISRFRLGELGVAGNVLFNGVTYNEIKKELNWPESLNTYKLMSLHPAINAPLNLFDSMVTKANLKVIPPKDATEDEKSKTEIVASMFDDMEHSIEDFLKDAMTAARYGFAPIEKVYRKRTKASGSIFDDGIIGIKKLALRNQKSIQKFIFDESGNEVLGVTQNVSGMSDPYNRFSSRKESEINIPRNKFLLITFGNERTNPFGVSPLREVYTHWRYLQAIEELEAQSVVKDINGLPVLSLPVQYMSADAPPEQKAQLEMFKNIMRNLQQGSQTSMILPSAYDPETRQPLFKIDLLTQDGKKNFNLSEIKSYYRAMLFIGLGADILMLGTSSGSSGSFALGAIKNSLTASVAESFLRRIIQEINNDLIRQIYELNGWDISRRCKLDVDGFDSESLDELGKYIQRVTSVGLMPKTEEVVNLVLNKLGLDDLPEGTDVNELLSDNTSRAADGMVTPGEGTATNVSGNDTSSLNTENAA